MDTTASNTNEKFVLSLDYGSDSVRCLIVDTSNGHIVGNAIQAYPRWAQGAYCDPAKNRFRQHPLDYLESLQTVVAKALAEAPKNTASKIVGMALDTTGSTVVAVDKSGTPLALKPEFAENPNAMFLLWKDHSALKEAAEITKKCKDWKIDYTQFVGGTYSSEWFWAKALHVSRNDAAVRESAYSWVEHCDWLPFLLTGGTNVDQMKRSRCAAGHKALWHQDYRGLPEKNFLNAVDPILGPLRDRLYETTYTADQIAGTLCATWAEKLGLPENISINVGTFDAHAGAVGGQIQPYYLSKVIGTSTCDMLTAPLPKGKEKAVAGICGQVHGSISPNMLGLEAGQSAFGDVFAWFKKVVTWPIQHMPSTLEAYENSDFDSIFEQILPKLSAAAAALPDDHFEIVALDWLNGRRTPHSNQNLKGALMGLSLGTDAPGLFKALVEATCFGAKKILDQFINEGIPINGIIALGGVAQKSPYIMQTLSNTLERPIHVAKAKETCALGMAMFAAAGAGIYETVNDAMEQMGHGFEITYQPNLKKTEILRQRYLQYEALGQFVERNEATLKRS